MARQVTLTQVLEGQIEPEWVRDRAVLIGVTVLSIDDAFYTPYSATLRQIHRMPGVTLHAQIVSQLLDVVLEDRPLLWDWPKGWNCCGCWCGRCRVGCWC
uniref:CHASE2 domain-containing protein n=1 Tax=Desertifilum tharense IPPAS B-1220 TaxID=1781255 RepID=A0ACD5GU45_9CYAN